jgi:hypothetical protein
MNTVEGRVVERRFEAGAGAELSVSNVSGRISIHAADTSTITVRATKSGSSRAMENTRIELWQDGNRINVQTKGGNAGRFNLGRNVSSVEYDIEVPAECDIRAKAVSSDVDVTGIRGRLSAQTVSGDVSLTRVTGECTVTTVSGDLVGTDLHGPLTVHTTSGDSRISASQLQNFNLHSVSGDFAIESPLTAGAHYLIKTVSGDLQLLIPGDTGATAQLKSVSGDVVSEFPAEIIKAGRRHWLGRINGGGANVEMNSVSGDMRIAPSSGVPVSRPPEPEQSTREVEDYQAEPLGDTASTVLQALEQGEITVEEAMARLEALR